MISLLSPPTVTFCEKVGSGLIARPNYAISNFAYILVAAVLLVKKSNSKILKAFAYTSFLIGTVSFVYDAKPIYLTQIMDLTGMLIFVCLLLALNFSLLLKVDISKIIKYLAVAVVIGDMVIIYFKGFAGNVIFGLFVLTAIITEYLIFRRKLRNNYKYWVYGLALFVVGFAIWLFDVSKTICSPVALLNGRAIFHYLTAITIYFLALFYSKNDKISS